MYVNIHYYYYNYCYFNYFFLSFNKVIVIHFLKLFQLILVSLKISTMNNDSDAPS